MILSKRFFLILLILLPIGLFADAIMITRAMTASTIAEVYIEKDQIHVMDNKILDRVDSILDKDIRILYF